MSQTLPSVSVVIVSWQRPVTLRRCLLALQQQDHPALEIRLVADGASSEQAFNAMRAAGCTAGFVANPGNNISLARNMGLGVAQGEVVAFIDDDAVPEPTWASRLARAFLDPQVVAATGYTLGRNGISLQWGAAETDAAGQDHPLPITSGISLHAGTLLRAVKPVGTNCAFRRSSLLAAGGFDPAYRFYLEDADIGLRLAPQGLTAIVPEARVHHAFAASARRRQDRVPTSLYEIAASIAVFLRRHAPEMLELDTLPAIEAQRDRVARLRAENRLSPPEAEVLLDTLAAGWDDGMARPLGALPPIAAVPSEFLRLAGTGPKPGRVIAGRPWQKPRLLRQAAAAVAAGEIVTVFCLAPSPRAHRVQFTDQGFWLQTGGLFGWSTRQGPRLRLTRFSARVAEETARVAPFRPVR